MSHEHQKKLADEVAMQQLQKQNDRMKQLVPIDGFIKAYFELLKTVSSNIEAFEILNNEYFMLFGVYRYNSYESFKTVKNRNIRK